MATAYICPMCVFNCDNLPDLEQHLEAHENNLIQSPVKQQQTTKSIRNSPLYAKSHAQQQQNRSPINNSHSPLNSSPIRSSPNKTYERRYSCKSCPFSTHSVKAYFNHRQMAHGEQLVITECPFCDYASQYPGKVKKHLTDEHPLQQMSNVESPIQSNRTSARGNSINNTIEQNGKINIETTGTRFTDCPFCSFTSIDSEAFRKHVLTNHLSDKNFRCLVCNRLYRYRGDCSFHIRKKHSDRMIGDNIESLREYVGEFEPNSMTVNELKELLSCPLTPSLASIPSNETPNNSRQVLIQNQPQPNSTHAFRCGYCKFSSVNSGDVKKHQTWKHANLMSNILPIDPNDPQQQPSVSYKRKRVHSTKPTNNEEDGPIIRRPRISMPSQRQLTIDTSPTTNVDNESPSKDLLSPNEPVSLPFDCDQSTIKTNNTQLQLSATGSLSSRVYKCTRCERLAPHRWIIERHIRAKHPSDLDNMSNVILEIDKPLTSSINGEPMTATKASSSDQDTLTSEVPKAFSCSACSLQSYHLWVILRHIRKVHENDGSNAKIIDNINNQIIEDNDDLESDIPVSSVSSNMTTIATNDDNDEIESQQHDVNNEEMLKRLINTAMATRKTNATNTFLENLPTSLINNNVAASLANLLGQLTNKQLIQQQQQFQTEKAPLIKRYKCSLCSHISAWGGNVKKHLKRMHPGDHSGHVIDLGLDFTTAANQFPTQVPIGSDGDEFDETNEQQIYSTNTNKILAINENGHQSYQQICLDEAFRDKLECLLIVCTHCDWRGSLKIYQEHLNNNHSNVRITCFICSEQRILLDILLHLQIKNDQQQKILFSQIHNTISILSNKATIVGDSIKRLVNDGRSYGKSLQIYNQELSTIDNERYLNEMISAYDHFDREIESLEQRLKDRQIVSFDGTLTWKISDIEQKMDDAKFERPRSIYSPAFYSSSVGYKMCSRLFLNGVDHARGTHWSIFFLLMRGDFDALLEWPFRFKVTFSVLDQSMSKNNQIHWSKTFWSDIKSTCFRRPRSERNAAYGFENFLSLKQFQQNQHRYVQNDTIFIKVEVDFLSLPPAFPSDSGGMLMNDDRHADTNDEDSMRRFLSMMATSNGLQ